MTLTGTRQTTTGETSLTTRPDEREFLRLMFLAREGDRREGILLRQGKGWFQVSGMGHETLGALAWALRPEDYLFPYYRDRALMLARGITNEEMALAYLAKKASSSAGRQMPGHYSDRTLNIFSVATPTASQCLPAAGAAWGFQLAGTDAVALTTIGDASTRQGEFYEAVAFALQENLPLILVIEDNRYGISTPTDHFFPYKLGALGEKALVRVDARDPLHLFDVASERIQLARDGGGPTILWCELDRLCSHTSSDDQRLYRPAEDLALDATRDPIALFAEKLISEGKLTAREWEAEQAEIVARVDDDYIRAERAADPEAMPSTHLFGTVRPAPTPPLAFEEPTTMVAALNATLRAALGSDERVIMLGEDIADPKGGVFGLTKGLSTEFPAQVFNAPLAEATIVGAAVGLAASGFKPVFEIQFTDFIPPAFNQLITNVANLRWRTAGEWTCPMVLIAPYGAYLPGGSIWHSESNEGIWAHLHGLNVVVPSTPDDAAALLWTALHTDDPTLFLVPKHIFRKRSQPIPTMEPVPLGKAVVRRAGDDITLVSFGNCMELCEQAAETLSGEGVSVELIDLRCIKPLDIDTIVQSIGRTGRLVVVHEDARTTGIGQAIVTELVAHPDRFSLLYSAPRLVARQDTYIGFNPILEYAALPSVAQVLEALRGVME
jgi:2-oxoisovalerate dehydrogenase E1 component